MNIDYEAWEKRALESIPEFVKLAQKLIDEKYISVDENGKLAIDDKFSEMDEYEKQ
jgi:hypothetical protein